MGNFKRDRFNSDSPRSGGRFARKDSDRPGRFQDRGNRFSGQHSNFGDDRPRFERRNTELEMHEVTCDKCGKQCEVPFKPTSSKPVYCRECFKKGDSFDSGPRSNQTAPDLSEINRKLDKIIKALNIE